MALAWAEEPAPLRVPAGQAGLKEAGSAVLLDSAEAALVAAWELASLEELSSLLLPQPVRSTELDRARTVSLASQLVIVLP